LLRLLAKTLFQPDPFIDRFENLLMAEVQAVEISDRDRGANIQIAESALPFFDVAMEYRFSGRHNCTSKRRPS
jgi:hypothetical protein